MSRRKTVFLALVGALLIGSTVYALAAWQGIGSHGTVPPHNVQRIP